MAVSNPTKGEPINADLNKPYSKLRTAVVETYLERYILDFSKKI